MQVAHELNVDEDEVLAWPKEKFERWVAYLTVSAELRKKANKG